MNLDSFRVLNLRRLRDRKLRTAASILGIAAGVSLVVSMLSLLTSVQATAASTVDLLGGAQLEIVAAKPLSSQQLAALSNLDGVEHVQRFVQTPVLVDGTLGWLIALEPQASLTTATSRSLASVSGLTVGPGFPGSGQTKLTMPDGTTQAVDTSQSAPNELNELFAGKFVAADIATALDLQPALGAPIPVSLLIYGTADRAKVQQVVGDSGQVEFASARVARARRVFQVLFSSLSILGSMGLVVGAFLLFNTMNMAVLERRQEIAALRALGSSGRRIWGSLMGEALLLGAIGSAIGLLLGSSLARSVVATTPDAFARTIGTPLRASVPTSLLLTAWVVGILTSLIAAIGPVRRTLSIQPIEALRPEESPPDASVAVHMIPLVIGVVWLAVMAFTDLIPSIVSVGTALLPLLLITYGLAQPIARVVCMLAKRFGTPGELAALSLQRAPRRVWATTTTVLVSIAIAVAATATVINLTSTNRQDLLVQEESDFWIGTTSGDNVGLTALPLEWKTSLAAIPGVSAIAGTRWISTFTGVHTIGVLGINGKSAYSFSRSATPTAQAQMTAGTGVIVTAQYAKTFSKKLGETVDLPGASPAKKLPIAGIANGITATSGGLISISAELLERHYGIVGSSLYEVQVADGANLAAVRSGIEELAKTSSFPVQVNSGKDFTLAAIKAGDQVLSLVTMMLFVITLCAGIALLNTLLASVLDRTREVAVLRAIGATQRQLVRSVVAESLAIGVVGGLLGAVTGTVLHRIMIDRIAEMTSFNIVGAFAPLTIVMAIFAGVSISIVGGLIPARRVGRLDLLASLSS
jgi:putative ABC transport system permease protein